MCVLEVAIAVRWVLLLHLRRHIYVYSHVAIQLFADYRNIRSNVRGARSDAALCCVKNTLN